MHAVMSNNDAEKMGENILMRGANLMDNIDRQKRTWNKTQTQGNDSIRKGKPVGNDSNCKRKKFLKPSDD